ncbi:MAG TPA: hypothetical protein VHD32_02900 [Candidatus Didemnitutus sp.]|nr:hypothetical protein [Candidatus Didemnitutus sp.]
MKTTARSAILLSLRELSQLFNSMDPSPFVERDLDADAEEFIASWARELPPGRELELVINLATPSTDERLAGVEDAVRRYFSNRAELKRRELGWMMRRGRLSSLVGVLFLVACLVLAHFVGRFVGGTAADIVREGLTICGWVAMWRPLEIYLYDWWPLYEERRHFERLSRINVRVVMPNADGTGRRTYEPTGHAA